MISTFAWSFYQKDLYYSITTVLHYSCPTHKFLHSWVGGVGDQLAIVVDYNNM